MRLTAQFVTAWHVVFATDNEELRSVTCEGTEVPVRRVGTMAGGRRAVYAAEFPDLMTGSLTVHVQRGSMEVTESVPTDLTPSDDSVAHCD